MMNKQIMLFLLFLLRLTSVSLPSVTSVVWMGHENDVEPEFSNTCLVNECHRNGR